MPTSRRFSFAERVAAIAIRDLGALQVYRELADLLVEVRDRQPRIVLEVGTRTGATLWAFSQMIDYRAETTFVSVDLTNRGRKLDALLPGRELHVLVGNSHHPQTLIDVERALDGRAVDLLHIDGDHTAEGAQLDVAMYGPLCGPGSLAVLHDVRLVHPPTHSNVAAVWSRLEQLPGARVIEHTDPGEIALGFGLVPGDELARALRV